MIFNPVDSALFNTEPIWLKVYYGSSHSTGFSHSLCPGIFNEKTFRYKYVVDHYVQVPQGEPTQGGPWRSGVFDFFLCSGSCLFCVFLGGPESQRLLGTQISRQRPYCVENTGSLPNSEVKHRKARIVLGWVTAREVLRVLLAFFIALFFFIYTLSGWKPCDIFLHYIYVRSYHMRTIYTFNRTDSDWTLAG